MAVIQRSVRPVLSQHLVKFYANRLDACILRALKQPHIGPVISRAAYRSALLINIYDIIQFLRQAGERAAREIMAEMGQISAHDIWRIEPESKVTLVIIVYFNRFE